MSWESILFNMGRKADAASAAENSTLFSWVKSIFSKVGGIETAVNDIEIAISQSGSSAIKSIQRGTRSGAGTINISSVNTAKSIVLLNGAYASSGNPYTLTALPVVTSLNSTSVTIGRSGKAGYTGLSEDTYNWQVIEFY